MCCSKNELNISFVIYTLVHMRDIAQILFSPKGYRFFLCLGERSQVWEEMNGSPGEAGEDAGTAIPASEWN